MADNEDDESWLYGDVEQQKKDESAEKLAEIEEMDTHETIDKPEIDKNEKDKDDPAVASSLSDGELVDKDTENETDDKNADCVNGTKDKDVDSDSDDDVQVTIGEITTGSTPNFPPNKSFYRNPVAVPTAPKPVVKGLDVNAPGDINGTPVLEFNLDSLEEKPWTKPGADISDYFNYGFNEASWRSYCEKQKGFRTGENNATVLSLPLQKPLPLANLSNIFGTPKLQRQYNPIRPFENTVQTISTLQVSRRKGDELTPGTAPPGETKTPVSTEANLNSPSSNSTTPKPTTSFPPPSIPQAVIAQQPPMFPPMNSGQPPPGLPLGVPPPGFPIPGVMPPGMPPIPGMVLPGMPPRGFPGMPMMPQQFYDPNMEGMPSDGKHDDGRYSDEDGHYRRERSLSSRRDDRDRDRRDYRDRDKRDRYRERDRGRDRERDRDRDRSERTDRDRSERPDRERSERDRSERSERDRSERGEYERGDRERDYERERDREPERERESSRRHRDDGTTHKSSRRKYEDDERYSSKHKKSKKHKHKDKELSAPGTEEIENGET